MKIFFRNIFQLILHPAHGWEDIAKENTPARIPALGGLLPLIIIAALSVFLAPIYHSIVDWTRLVFNAVATFTMFFPAYFLGAFMLINFAGPMLKVPLDENKCNTFALYTIGLLAIITILTNCFPFLDSFIYFLPIYVAIIQWKGIDYMSVKPEAVGHFMMLAVLGVLAPPYIIYFLFSLIIR
ncbi:MAG: hypothetical protein NC098_01420 [Lachnoclostridium sp.]|nr:hypothetical protein [Lachnoclostridium sp.]